MYDVPENALSLITFADGPVISTVGTATSTAAFIVTDLVFPALSVTVTSYLYSPDASS